jgi:hypothetical protein
VVCPHCGHDTGVPADPIAQSEIATLPELPPTQATHEEVALNAHSLIGPLGSAIATGVTKVVNAAFDLVVDDDSNDGPLPRAIAREKPRHDTNTETTPTHPKILK